MVDAEIYILSSDDEDDSFDRSSLRRAVDDECMILNGDPDKPLDIANDSRYTSDELLIVAEKGQVACRDYPHPRHLCARFPFISNPHEKSCDLCHCYVCDSKAPCAFWGNGFSSSDHCHATDKEDIWRVQREWLKKGHRTQLPMPNHSNITLPMEPLRVHSSSPVSTPSHPLNRVYGQLQSNWTFPVLPLNFIPSLSMSSVITHRNPEQPGHDRFPGSRSSTSTSFSPGASNIANSSTQEHRSRPPVSPCLNSERAGSARDTLEKTRHGNGFNKNCESQKQDACRKYASYYERRKVTQKQKTCQSANQKKTVSGELNVSESASQLNNFPKVPVKVRSIRKKIVRSLETLSAIPILSFTNALSRKETVTKNTVGNVLSDNNKPGSRKVKTSQKASQQKQNKSQNENQSTNSKELSSGDADQVDDQFMELRNKRKLHCRTSTYMELRNKRKIYQ